MFTVEESKAFQDGITNKARARLRLVGHLSPVTMVLMNPDEAEKLRGELGMVQANARADTQTVAAVVVDMNANWELKVDYIRFIWPENRTKLAIMMEETRKRFGPDHEGYKLDRVVCNAIYQLAGFDEDKDLYAAVIETMCSRTRAFATLMVCESWATGGRLAKGQTPDEAAEAAGVKGGNVKDAPGSYEALSTLLQTHKGSRLIRQEIKRTFDKRGRDRGKVIGFGELEEYDTQGQAGWTTRGRFADLLRPF